MMARARFADALGGGDRRLWPSPARFWIGGVDGRDAVVEGGGDLAVRSRGRCLRRRRRRTASVSERVNGSIERSLAARVRRLNGL